jgi:hypothetical protein
MSERDVILGMTRAFERVDSASQVREVIRTLKEPSDARVCLEQFLAAGFDELAEDPARARALANQVLDRVLEAMMVDAAELREDAVIGLHPRIAGSPALSVRLERLMDDLVERDQATVIEVIRKDGWRTQVDLVPGSGRATVSGLEAGEYEIRLSGRVIWSGEILPRHVLWEDTGNGRLRFAAATEDHDEDASLYFRLLGHDVEVRVYPGVESGTLEIGLR